MELDPRHGIHQPTASTPARADRSVRRTTTHDLTRPHGLKGDLVIDANGRDIVTMAGGGTSIVAESRVRAVIDFFGGRTVTALSTDPERPLYGLIGRSASGGFRGAIEVAAPALREEDPLLYQLLDDIPVATLVSGYATGFGGLQPLRIGPKAEKPVHPNLCAGWVPDSTMMRGVEATGRTPLVTGPLAPSLEVEGDELAWHALAPLPAHSVRRRRRIDLMDSRDDEGSMILDAMFRDTHMAPDGEETVIHEYAIHGTLDARSLELTQIAATPRVLPWPECSNAAASAVRLRGRPVGTLRDDIRTQFVGPATCTHLNDALRSLEDVGVLASLLGQW